MSQCKLLSSVSLFVAVFVGHFTTRDTYAVEQNRVDGVLAQESNGVAVNRRQVLADQSDSVSQWQAGRILIDGEWADLESIEKHAPSPKIAAYNQQRGSQELDIEGHRRLAKWCQSHQMSDMATVHWKAVIMLDNQDAQARKALKYKQIGNQWFAQDELKLAAEQEEHDRISLKKWMPKVRKIVTNLQSGKTDKVLDATDELAKIDTEDAISALMYGTFQIEPSVAVPLVSQIESMRSTSASLALCQIAMSSPNSESGRLAIQGLKEYDEHFYVPELLNALEPPIKLQQTYFYMPNGSLAARRAYLRETLDEKQEVEIIKLISVRNDISSIGSVLPMLSGLGLNGRGLNGRGLNGRGLNGRGLNGLGMMEIAASPEITRQVQSSLEKVAQIDVRKEQRINDTFNDLNAQRAINCKVVLASVSGLPADSPVEAFWNWWPNFNENPTNAEKPTNSVSFLDDSSYADVANQIGVSPSSTVQTAMQECLVAGTVIQTSSGLQNIEDLKIGDQAVSMDVRSGEILVRPITNVSNRTASESYKICTSDGEMIQATGGHHWWVLGKGWLRSRQLQEGQFMRTGDASVQIKKIEKIDGPIKVYNLVVDQTHTYFVGKDRLLSWDVTSLQPTLQTVPGQSGSKVAAFRK